MQNLKLAGKTGDSMRGLKMRGFEENMEEYEDQDYERYYAKYASDYYFEGFETRRPPKAV